MHCTDAAALTVVACEGEGWALRGKAFQRTIGDKEVRKF
jgi:hypothetical protein